MGLVEGVCENEPALGHGRREIRQRAQQGREAVELGALGSSSQLVWSGLGEGRSGRASLRGRRGGSVEGPVGCSERYGLFLSEPEATEAGE